MAHFNRPRGVGFNNSNNMPCDFMRPDFLRFPPPSMFSGSPAMQNMNSQPFVNGVFTPFQCPNTSVPPPSFAGRSGHFYNQMPPNIPYNVPQNFQQNFSTGYNDNSRMPTPTNVILRQPFNNFGGCKQFQRPRLPQNPGERYFVPWNVQPKQFEPRNFHVNRPRAPVPNNNTSSSNQQGTRQPISTQDNQKIRKKRKLKLRNRQMDNKKLKSWMTDEIFQEVQKKNKMYYEAKNNEKEEALWHSFRAQRNKVSALIKEAKTKAGIIKHRRKEDDDGKDRPFGCDTCDRGFVQQTELDEHIAQHIKCDVPGCTFEAHVKIVENHKKIQHDMGYDKFIFCSKTDADIQQWRNLRKSRFPTMENVLKRQAEYAEKIARGEIIETKEFGKFKRRTNQARTAVNGRCKNGRFSNKNGRNHLRIASGQVGKKYKSVRHRKDSNLLATGLEIAESGDDNHITLPMFKGMTSELEPHDSEELLKPELKSFREEKDSNSILDITDSDDEPPTIEPIQRKNNELINNNEISKPPDISVPNSLRKSTPGKSQQPDDSDNDNNRQINSQIKTRHSLLEKLLANEIRHERNVILQCVRHIAKNNFFGLDRT